MRRPDKERWSFDSKSDSKAFVAKGQCAARASFTVSSALGDYLLQVTYKDDLDAIRGLGAEELQKRLDVLLATCPERVRPWPVGMPASLQPKLVIIGVSPGNSPMAGDSGAARGYSSWPTVAVGDDSHFLYRDGARYWPKVRRLIDGFFASEGSVVSVNDQLSLTSHFNLGTGRAGTASTNAVERDIVGWVSNLLNAVHDTDLVILLGLGGILRSGVISGWWNSANGLRVDWRRPDREWSMSPYAYKYRGWSVRNARDRVVRIVAWPNHPSRHPFADMNVWSQSVQDFFDGASRRIPS